jgi:murein DD-endopeptidase MepM/ murein hydrolase activator NlpD
MPGGRWLRWLLVGVALTGAAGGVQLLTRAAPAPAADAPPILSAYRSLDGANKARRLFRHAGVDFGAAAGTPVIAAADGRVVQVIDWGPGCGRGVILEHPEFKRYTAYCHLREALVRIGEEVAKGRIIGRVGTSGEAVGVPHVHFELCTSPCSSHSDGDLWGTADPMKIAAGCFDAKRSYSMGRLALTYPIPCGGLYRER